MGTINWTFQLNLPGANKLVGKLRGVFYKHFDKEWPSYDGTWLLMILLMLFNETWSMSSDADARIGWEKVGILLTLY